MKLHLDLEFFQTLRQGLDTALMYRNDLRLARAKKTDGNVFRPMANCRDELAEYMGYDGTYPTEEA